MNRWEEEMEWREEGYKEGYKEEFKKGYEEGRLEMLASLVRDGALNLEEAAQKVDMTKEAFQRKVEEVKE